MKKVFYYLKQNSNYVRFLCAIVFTALVGSSVAQSFYPDGVISFKASDFINEQPLPNTHVKIFKISSYEDGKMSILPLNRVIDLKIDFVTDAQGNCTIKIPMKSALPEVFQLRISHDGYEDKIALYVKLQSGQNIRYETSNMYKLFPTENERKIMEDKFNLDKENLEEQKKIESETPLYTEPVKKQNESESCEYNVPENVTVKNLHNCYNASANSCVLATCSNCPQLASCISEDMPIDMYVAGVVEGELRNIKYLLETRKCQAVAARTYAVKHTPANVGQSYCSEVSSQSLMAATLTTGQVLLYNGSLIDALYFARCNGDYTQNSNEGYFKNCQPSGNYIPYLISVSCSNHPNCHDINQQNGCCPAIISTTNKPGYLYGHGVGLCQEGAQGFVKQGKTYDWILTHFYTGACLSKPSGVSISFVIDNTGSMTNDLEAVKQSTLDILNDPTFISGSEGKLLQLTTFKDDVSQFEPTTDLDVLKDEINGLYAEGGDDCPEASVDAINVAQQNMSDGGEIYLATDADSHSDVSREEVNSNLLAKNIIENDILTGSCSETFAAKKSSQSDLNITPSDIIKSSENNKPKEGLAAESDGVYNSIETFSYMANVTGGVYSFIPEIKSGSAEAYTRYENTWFNMVLGSVTPTIAFVNPTQGELGSELALTINGIRTHFNPSTKVAFADPGITTESITVLSPTQLQALITIDKNVSLGFKDINVLTPLANDSIEKAAGKGALQITAATTSPTILSIAPYSGTQGQKMTVQVTGINTHFSNSSILNLGAGITVSKVNGLSPEIIDANITIATNADPGYRDVTVTTGSEIARETITGPFLVLLSDCDISGLDLGPDTTIDRSKNDSCITLEVKGINKDSLSTYSFLWSTGETTPTIKVCPDITTSYGVTVLKGTCKFTDEITVLVNNNNKPQLSIMDLVVDKTKNIAFVKVKLINASNKIVLAKYATKDSTAKKGEDYISLDGFVTFIPHVNTTAVIPIRLFHRDQTTGDKYFKVILRDALNAEITDSLAIVTIKCNGGPNSIVNSQRTTIEPKIQEFRNDVLRIDANPNPSSNSFKIKVTGNTRNEKINLVVYNEIGALIESRTVMSGETVEIGGNYKPGVYLIQVNQGNDIESAKIMKISK